MSKVTQEDDKESGDMDETVLVRRAQSGDEEAFGELASRYSPLVFSIARARLDSVDTAEELTQEVLLRVYLTLPSLRHPGAFPGWIRRVARNLASDWRMRGLRKSRLVMLIPMDDLEEEIPERVERNARDTAALHEETRQLDWALARLPLPLREVVILRYLEGLSQPEAARCLGLHPTSVSRRLDHALDQLRTVLPMASSESGADCQASRTAALIGNRRSLVSRSVRMVAAAAALSEGARASALQSISSSSSSAGWFASFGALPSKLLSSLSIGGTLVTKTQALAATAILAATGGGVVYLAKPEAGTPAVNFRSSDQIPVTGIAEFDRLARAAPGDEFVVRIQPSASVSAPASASAPVEPLRWSGGSPSSGLIFITAKQPLVYQYASILKVNNQLVTGPAELKEPRYDVFVRTPPFDGAATGPLSEKEVRAMAAQKLLDSMGWSQSVESVQVTQFRFVDPGTVSPGGSRIAPPPRTETLERLEAERRRSGKSPGSVWGRPVAIRTLVSQYNFVPSPAGSFRLTVDPTIENREAEWWRRGQVSVPSGEAPLDLVHFVAALYQVGYIQETAVVDLHRIRRR